MSAAAFTRQQGLNYTTFCGWRHRRTKAKTSPEFVEVELAGVPTPAELVVELPGNVRMRLTSAGQIEAGGATAPSLQRTRVMLSFHAHLKVFVATAPCDLRMSFNGLWAAVQQRLGDIQKRGALRLRQPAP